MPGQGEGKFNVHPPAMGSCSGPENCRIWLIITGKCRQTCSDAYLLAAQLELATKDFLTNTTPVPAVPLTAIRFP